jgi:hypothetical protein
LEVVLQRLVIVVVVVGGILHDDDVIAFTDFSPLLRLPFPQDLDSTRRRLRLEDELLQVLLQHTKTSV